MQRAFSQSLSSTATPSLSDADGAADGGVSAAMAALLPGGLPGGPPLPPPPAQHQQVSWLGLQSTALTRSQQIGMWVRRRSAPSERLAGLARWLGAQAPIRALLSMCQLSRSAGRISCNTRQSACKPAQRPIFAAACPVPQDAREQQAQRHRQGMHGMGQQQGLPPPSAGLQPSSGSGAHSRNSSLSGPNGSGILPQPQGGSMNGILLGGGGPPPPVLQHSTSARLGAVGGTFGGGYGSVESSLASLGSLGGPAGLVRLGAGGGGVQQQHPAARYPVTASVAGSESEWGGAGGPADSRPQQQQWQALQRAASGGVMASAVGMNVMARDFASQHQQHLQQQSQQQHRRQQQAQQQMANGGGRPGMYAPMGHDASLGASMACVGYL